MTKAYKASLIGLAFTAVNLLLTRTYAFPMLAVMPAAVVLEGAFTNTFGNDPFYPVGQATLITLLFLELLLTFFYLWLVARAGNKNEAFDTGMFIGFLTLQVFLVHPLGFYIYLSQNWSRAGDGQVLFSVVKTFPVSSFAFVILGLLTDKVKNSRKIPAKT